MWTLDCSPAPEREYKSLTDAVDELELWRKGHLRFIGAFFCLVALPVLYLLYGFVSPPPEVQFTVLFALALFGGFMTRVAESDYRRKAKRKVTMTFARSMGLAFKPTGCFTAGSIHDHGILPVYGRHRVEDGFEGTANGVSFAFQEIFLERPQHDGQAPPRLDRDFSGFASGILARIELRTHLLFHTMVLPKGTAPPFCGPYEKVGLVSSAFEKRFDVYSTHQVESRVIFDPAFMERFLAACEAMSADSVSASFMNNDAVFFFQYRRNMFEVPGIFTPLWDHHFEPIVAEIKTLSSLVDLLSLKPDRGL